METLKPTVQDCVNAVADLLKISYKAHNMSLWEATPASEVDYLQEALYERFTDKRLRLIIFQVVQNAACNRALDY